MSSAPSIALVTRDVYVYLRKPGVRRLIEDGIRTAITPGVETVVVAHSLGSIIAYNLLRREGRTNGWTVPLFVTVGSPLAVSAVRESVRQFMSPTRTPECVGAWFNAMDPRDVVSLYPLDSGNFPLNPVKPAIENKINVDNWTDNRHGIAGYLNDAVVASRIHAALV